MLPELAADGQGTGCRRLFQAVYQWLRVYPIKARCWGGDAPLLNLSGMSRRYWRKAYPVRHLRRFGRNTESPLFGGGSAGNSHAGIREMSIFEGTCKERKEVSQSRRMWRLKRKNPGPVSPMRDQETGGRPGNLGISPASDGCPEAHRSGQRMDGGHGNEADRDPEKDPITEDEVARRILLTEFRASSWAAVLPPGTRTTICSGAMLNHCGWNAEKRPRDADIQG